MCRLSIHLISEDVPMAALLLAETGCFTPYEQILEGHEALTETAGTEYHELYHAAHSRFDKIIAQASKPLVYPQLTTDRVPGLDELEKTNQWLSGLWPVFSGYEERLRLLDERQRLLNNLSTSLDKFTGLDLDLGLLRKEKAFLDIRVGVLPGENLTRFTQSAGLAGYVLNEFHQQQGQVYVVIAGMLNAQEDDIGMVLNAAGFSTIQIPAEFHDRPEKIQAEMAEETLQIEQDKSQLEEQRDQSMEQHRQGLIDAWRVLKLIEPHVSLGQSVHSKGGLSVVNGWMPQREVGTICERLQSNLENACYIEDHKPVAKEYHDVPSAVCYPRWVKPFARLIRNYGTPRYGEFDPTWVFMASSILMFGIMFGDVGHGAVISMLAVGLRRKLGIYFSIVLLNGLASIFFGFCYGSLFGDEHILTPWWQSPLSDPVTMLMLALYFGMAFIALVISINIHNHINARRYQTALYSSNGAAGLLLLAALYFSGHSWLSGNGLSSMHYILLVLPLGLILQYNWRHSAAGGGEKPVIMAIELFEAMISLLSNTLSFLRVAAFSLNHVALMIAIFTIAGMMDTVGHWITLVLGNIFIIGFEGAIVMIQVLRLEYYEGLSRYFQGDGRLFKPLVFTGGSQERYCYL